MKTGALRIGPETREPLSPWGGGLHPISIALAIGEEGEEGWTGPAERTRASPPGPLQPGFYFTSRSFTLNACVTDVFSVVVLAISAPSWWKMASCRSMVVSRVRR